MILEESEEEEDDHDIQISTWKLISVDILNPAPPHYQFLDDPDCKFNTHNLTT